MKVIYRVDGEPPGRDVLIVGSCCDFRPEKRPGDVIRMLPVTRPRWFLPPELPPGLQVAAEPIAAFHCVQIAFRNPAWGSPTPRPLGGVFVDSPDPFDPIARAFLGPPVHYETAVEITATGPAPRFLPGWSPHVGWMELQRFPCWVEARRAAGIA